MRGTRSTTWIAALLLIVGGWGRQANAQAQEAGFPLDLGEAVDRALLAGQRVASAEASADAARAGAGVLSSAYLPKVAATGAVLSSEHPLTVTPIREHGVFPELDRTIYDVSVEAAWTLFDFGRGRAARQSALAAATAAGVRYDLARMETIETLASLYVRLAQLQERASVDGRRLDALRLQERDILALYEEGRVSRADVLRVGEAVLAAETDALSTENELETVLATIAAETRIARPLTVADVHFVDLPPVPPVLIDRETTAAPGIAAAEAQLHGAQAAMRESDRALLPVTELFASERLRSGSAFSFDSELSGGIRLRIPLFDGSLHARRQVRRAEVVAREAALEQARNDVEIAAGDVRRRIDELRSRSDAAVRRVAYLEETYRIDRAAYLEGRLTLSDLLNTESRLAAARLEELGVRASGLLHHLQLHVLHGSLTKEIALDIVEGRT